LKTERMQSSGRGILNKPRARFRYRSKDFRQIPARSFDKDLLRRSALETPLSGHIILLCRGGSVRTSAVSPASLRMIKSGVGHFDKLNRVARVSRE